LTHLFDTSAALAMLLAETGGETVAAILDDRVNIVGISALTLFEVDTAVLHRTGSQEIADRMVAGLR
jgi:PIN domain nuclease of toxin-antitoxin system